MSGSCFQRQAPRGQVLISLLCIKRKSSLLFSHLETYLRPTIEMMDFEREFFSSMGKQEIHFEKGIVRAVEGGAVELALERTDVGCFDPSDNVGE